MSEVPGLALLDETVEIQALLVVLFEDLAEELVGIDRLPVERRHLPRATA